MAIDPNDHPVRAINDDTTESAPTAAWASHVVQPYPKLYKTPFQTQPEYDGKIRSRAQRFVRGWFSG